MVKSFFDAENRKNTEGVTKMTAWFESRSHFRLRKK